ncbi:hypothetical protein Zm00014a_011682 [Zea mays]|uniref:Uncharacterized protein n=1 Tax=Zea mays TaxID=4577 RepID=A0A3L6FSC3_MAIZE|nr:hypothetical protein Zm00014a_011682 [Zea mays]
MGLGRTTLL